MQATAEVTDLTYSPITKALINAVTNNNPSLVNLCISLGANVRVVLEHGNSLLHICKGKEVATALLKAGADINAPNFKKQTPLHKSMRRNIPELTNLFIQEGANLNAQEDNGTTPLHLAEDPKINNALLTNHADPNKQNIKGNTALHKAASSKGEPIINALLNADADKSIVNYNGFTAYDVFVRRWNKVHNQFSKVAKELKVDSEQFFITQKLK